ncbi:MAG: D-alanyl-D-alanine carboxypeptidase family protein [Oscillospiraceae bacterium]|nr:D-alanyl-D-alanine carboxypeptidase family protein [Oscillospiraceae bacterium]
MKRYLSILLLLILLLSGCATRQSGKSETTPTLPENPTETTAEAHWSTEDHQTFYILPDGTRHTGWLELDGKRYYLDPQGVLQTGWLELDGDTYYLKDDGSVTRGKATIEDRTHYFTATGAEIILANPWNLIPAGYTPDLQTVENGLPVDKSCHADLTQMLSDCRAAGHGVQLISAYRRHTTQIELYNNKVWYYLDKGYTEADARKEAATIVAVPGTSEHELGLAVDLADSSYPYLDEAQENTAAQKWLMEHCWEYGFILRYPNHKSEKTGIIYEPWHYRYVGKELAKELQTSGLCLEEYLESLY